MPASVNAGSAIQPSLQNISAVSSNAPVYGGRNDDQSLFASRRQIPSPLQVVHSNTSSSPLKDGFLYPSPHAATSYVDSPKTSSSPSYSPRSPRYSPGLARAPALSSSPGSGSSGSTKNTTSTTSSKEHSRLDSPSYYHASPLVTPREGVTFQPLRKITAPILSPNGSSYTFPPDMASSAVRSVSGYHAGIANARTASIDSTVSTTSSATAQSQYPMDHSLHAAEIQQCVATYGSPEAAIFQLLKDKKQAAAQNAQLWRLMEKQRTLVLGLKKDLERALHEKHQSDRKYQESINQIPPIPSHNLQTPLAQSRNESTSPAPSESQDELPIQRHSILSVPHNNAENQEPGGSKEALSGLERADNESKDWKDTRQDVSTSDEETIAGSSITDDFSPKAESNRPSTPPRIPFSSAKLQTSPPSKDGESFASRHSFTARRSMHNTPHKVASTPLPNPTSPPLDRDLDNIPLSARKAPPAPLNLFGRTGSDNSQSLGEQMVGTGRDTAEDESGSEYDEGIASKDEGPVERGRRKTREEDDREREAILLKEQELRSQSSKSMPGKLSKEAKPQPIITIAPTPSIRTISPKFPSATTTSQDGAFASPPASLAGVLSQSNSSKAKSLSERSISSPFPLSPGLPLSPRPGNRPLHAPRQPREGAELVTSPPLSPFPGQSALPLTPRSPRHLNPFPIHPSFVTPSPLHISKPTTLASGKADSPTKAGSQKSSEASESEVLSAQEVSETYIPGEIYRGLVDDAHPDLLLPPNALPSILIKVSSSRLTPSRHSALALKGPEDELVFTLAVLTRSNFQQLWQVEKITMSLALLEKQLKAFSTFSAKPPERSLFAGHAPAKIDMRRAALEKYFEAILDTPMNEAAALVLCQYLSTDVIEPSTNAGPASKINMARRKSVALGTGGRETKEGFLTKRGKNFGGWKARFFVLDEPILRYYESPGGSLLGTIRLCNAQIGRQTTHHNTSQSPHRNDENDNHFRHAFLILEPKAKDTSKHLRHVLCAESDIERDQWVSILMQYVNCQPDEAQKRPQLPRGDSSHSKNSILTNKKKPTRKEEGDGESIEADTNNLQGISYEKTVQAQAPIRTGPPISHERDNSSPIPNVPSPAPKAISGPLNGSVISNAGAWGNLALDSPKVREKDQRKRSIWGFREKAALEQALHLHNESSSAAGQANGAPQPQMVRDVFGLPLADAVECCPARNSDMCLPAVVQRCLEYLVSRNVANEEGIFRIGGSNLVIKALRDRFATEGDVDLCADPQPPEISAVASLLKQYLRELPQNILTRELHLEFIQVLEQGDKPTKTAGYRQLVRMLPLPNYTLLRALSGFLIGIVSNSDVNKMNGRNVGIVFSPTLNIPAPVINAFITDFDEIFGSEDDFSPRTQALLPEKERESDRARERPRPEPLRSPKRTMLLDVAIPDVISPTFRHDMFQRQSILLQAQQAMQLNIPQEDAAPYHSHQPPATATLSHGAASLADDDNGHAKNRAASINPSDFTRGNPSSMANGIGSTGIMRDKARRRESAMLTMDGGDFKIRKPSLPHMRSYNGSYGKLLSLEKIMFNIN
ncbi:hypothetical protein MMC25_000129 [Agyrium rufum]|nr:hypothetical protein [Agyrium rufum]